MAEVTTSQPNKELLIRRTMTIVQAIPISSYGGMTPEEAAAYEREMDRAEKIGAFVEAVEFSNTIDFDEVITIQDVPSSPPSPVIPQSKA